METNRYDPKASTYYERLERADEELRQTAREMKPFFDMLREASEPINLELILVG